MITSINYFIIILLVKFLFYEAEVIQPTRNVSIDIDTFKLGSVNLYFVCPNIRSKTDVVRYYKITDDVYSLIKKETSGFGIIVELKSTKDLGKYVCSVNTESNIFRNATLNVMDEKLNESPNKFIYKTEETVYIAAEKGLVTLICNASDSEHVTWYKPPQYHIYSGNNFQIDDINENDYGTYYCAIGETRNKSLPVKKVILVKQIPSTEEKQIEKQVSYIETVTVKSNVVRFRPSNLIWTKDVITWEKPPGTILLNHGRDLYLPFFNLDESYFYRITRNEEVPINIAGKVILKFNPTANVTINVEDPIVYGAPLKLDCYPPSELNNDTEVIWKKNDKIIQKGNTLNIPKFEKSSFGKYSCEILGAQVHAQSFINLTPEKKSESKIEMTPDPGSFYIFHSGSRKELHCEVGHVDNRWIMKAKDIVWTINGKKFNNESDFENKINRLDTNSVSILVLKDMGSFHEGTYKCFQKSKINTAKLLMEKSEILVEIAPKIQTAADNVNQIAEFHCRIDTPNVNSSSIFWKFSPKDLKIEMDLPPEAKIEKPSLASSTSFVTIDNVLKKHEGLYVCTVLDKKVYGTLIVKAKPVLTVSPKEITLKPGSTARFLCHLNGIEGKVVWRRFDKKSLTPNKENRMGGSTQSLLEVTQVTTNDHGTVYECIFNNLVEYVTLLVQEECALNQRKCKNDTCIDENKFCDGNDDCGDNSDEDKEKCNECNPNSIHCDFLKNADPIKRCIISHWKCDGIDDCGNNFDELNCPIKNKEKCIGTHFLCNNDTLIPRSYWCDGDIDCKDMEDEEGCSHPQVIEPTKQTQISVFSNTSVVLTCQISGRPVPTISWRFNWGHLKQDLNYNITTTISNCSIITSTLTINDINVNHGGIYSCEGIGRLRVMAPDFSISVSKSLVCQRPFYNNDAWYSDMCIKCYCSNVTDDCTSATGYTMSPNLIESGIKPSDGAIVNYQTLEYYQPAKEVTFANLTIMKYHINEIYYESLVPNPDYYFGGAFNMAGSWLKRYGFPMTYKLILSGESNDYISGPLIMIQGESNSIYYCGVTYRLPVFASDNKYENNMKIILWEQDNWYKDYTCKQLVTRPEFLNILKNVRLILFKVKYFVGQTDFQMSKLTMQEAVQTKDRYSWVSRIEKCNCPSGYSGLSCEIKSNE